MRFSRMSGVVAVFALVVAAGIPTSSRAADAKEGENLYKTKCAACHGADGSGNTAVGKKMNIRDFRSPEVQKQSDDQLFEIIAKGKNKMPAYEKSLQEAQIKELVAYIREMGRKK